MNELMVDKIKTALEFITETIGERPTGASSNHMLTEFIKRKFRDLGYSVTTQSFQCIDWHQQGATLRVDHQSIPIVPSYYSKACTIESDYVMVGSIEALKEQKLQDKIVVLYGELTKEQLMPKNFKFYNPEHHQLIIQLLEEKKPLGIITVVDQGISILEDGDFNIPSGVVDSDYQTLLMNNSSAQLIINTQTVQSTSENIIATSDLQKKDTIVLTAHIDTKYNTPGALDNATGIIILLMLGELLAGEVNNHTIEFAFLNGEDYYSTPGQVQYFNTLNHQAGEIALAINCDGVGLKDSNTAISFFGLTTVQQLKVESIMKSFNAIEVIEPWQQGDHMLFVMHELPTIALTSKNIFKMIDEVIHTPKDNKTLIDVHKVAEVVRLIEQLISQW